MGLLCAKIDIEAHAVHRFACNHPDRAVGLEVVILVVLLKELDDPMPHQKGEPLL
jgi:hypothetical protein